MKRIFSFCVAVVMFAITLAYGANTRFPNGLTVGTESQEASATSGTGDGNLYVAGNVEVAGGVLNATEVFFDVPVASTITYVSGYGALGTISTTTLVSAGTSYTLAKGDYTNTAYPRNVVVAISFAAGTSTTAVVGTMVVSGVDVRGNSVTESISVSTTSATGNRAWSSITSLTLSITSISPINSSNAYINIGTGVKIGLANKVSSASDVLKVNEAAVATTTYTLNTTYNTITFVNAPDGSRDYKVSYKATSR